MASPLDHVTVIQQINFAERVHQDLQLHPDLTMHKAEAAHRRLRAENRQRPNPANHTDRTTAILHGYNYQQELYGSGTRVDLKA